MGTFSDRLGKRKKITSLATTSGHLDDGFPVAGAVKPLSLAIFASSRWTA
jgi:hypothetical protein